MLRLQPILSFIKFQDLLHMYVSLFKATGCVGALEGMSRGFIKGLMDSRGMLRPP